MTSPDTKKRKKSVPAGRKPKSDVKAKPRASKGRAKKKAPVPEPVITSRRVIIASLNEAKVRAVELGFNRMFPGEEFVFEGISVESGVGNQPMSDDETFAGALQRAMGARQRVEDASFWIGIEDGVEEIEDDFHAFAWMVVLGSDTTTGKSRTATFALPPTVTELVREGKGLSEANQLIFGGEENGENKNTLDILTQGIINRSQFYSEAVIMSLIPFKNHHLFLLEAAV